MRNRHFIPSLLSPFGSSSLSSLTASGLLAGAVSALLVLSGCGDTPEVQLQTAIQALAQNQPKQGLNYALKVLEAQPDNIEARLIAARAQMGLGSLDDARATIEELIEREPANIDARNLMIRWAFVQSARSLRKADFAKNEQQQSRFEETLKLGREHVSWLAEQPGQEAEAWYFRARLKRQEIARIDRLLKDRGREAVQHVEEDDPHRDEVTRSTNRLKDQRRDLGRQVESTLRKTFELEKDHFNAAEQLVGMLRRRKAWQELWILTRELAGQQDLPGGLGAAMVGGLIQMPRSVQPTRERTEMAWKVLSAVREDHHRSIDHLTSTARLYLYQREPAEAKKLLIRVLDSPRGRNHIDARYYMAHCHYGLEEFEEAKKILERLTTEKKAGISDAVWTLYGMTLIATGDTALAKIALKRARDINPQNVQAQQAYIELLGQKGILPDAEREVTKLYNTDRTNPTAIRQLIHYYQAISRTDAIRRLLDEEVQRLSPLTAEHLEILARGYLVIKEYDTAAGFARRLIDENREKEVKDLNAHLLLAETMLGRGQGDQVRDMLAEVRAEFPGMTDVDQMLGRLYLRSGRLDMAVEMFQKVVDAEPDNHQARLLLARALARLTLTTEALEHVNHVLEERLDSLDAHALAVRIYHLTGQKDKARDLLKHLEQEMVPERRYPALLALIKLNFEPPKPKQAAEICNRAIGKGVTDPLLRTILAGIYLKQDDLDQAEFHLLALVRADPDNLSSYGNLVRFYRTHSRVGEGIGEFRKLQTEGGNEVNTRLAEAQLHRGGGQFEDALDAVRPIFEPLIRKGDRQALLVADSMARTHMKRGDGGAAIEIYQRLVDARFLADRAMIRQIDMWLLGREPDRAIERLNELAALVGPSKRRMAAQVIRRYMLTQQHEPALILLDTWIGALDASDTGLLYLKGEVLLAAKRPADAVAAFEDAVELAPESLSLRARLAGAHIASFDFPAAMAIFDEVERIDKGARIAALSGKGQIFLQLGLKEQANEAFAELETVGAARDPRVLYAMGRAYAEMEGKGAMALARLEQIPPFAAQYAKAQILMARIEQSGAEIDSARKRLNDLAGNSRTALMAINDLLDLNIRSTRDEDLLRWSDEAMASAALNQLPRAQQRRWLGIRVALNANVGKWNEVLATLERWSSLEPDLLRLAMGRILVLMRLNQVAGARHVYGQTPGLKESDIGPALATLLREPYESRPGRVGLDAWLEAVCRGEVDEARARIESLPMMRAVFRADLAAMLKRGDIDSAEMTAAARRMLGATVALGVGLPQLADELLRDAIARVPTAIPAHALRVRALIEMDRPIDAALDLVRQAGPSKLKLLLKSHDQQVARRHADAAATLWRLLEFEPGNVHIQYQLAVQLQAAGQFEDAIKILEQMAEQPGPYWAAALNDLSYLLAEHTDQLDRAYGLAKASFEAVPNSAPLRDTLGWLEHARGNDRAALEHLSRAIAALSTLPEVHYHLGVVYQALGNEVWARYHLEAAASGDPVKPEAGQAKAILGKWGN